MDTKTKISLDRSKLYGFKLLDTELASAEYDADGKTVSATIGAKIGGGKGFNVPSGSRAGAKVGIKGP